MPLNSQPPTYHAIAVKHPLATLQHDMHTIEQIILNHPKLPPTVGWSFHTSHKRWCLRLDIMVVQWLGHTLLCWPVLRLRLETHQQSHKYMHNGIIMGVFHIEKPQIGPVTWRYRAVSIYSDWTSIITNIILICKHMHSCIHGRVEHKWISYTCTLLL